MPPVNRQRGGELPVNNLFPITYYLVCLLLVESYVFLLHDRFTF